MQHSSPKISLDLEETILRLVSIGSGMRVGEKDVTNPDHWIRGPFSFCLTNMKNKETLDHIFATDLVNSLYFSAIVDRDALNASDHCPIYCDLAW